MCTDKGAVLSLLAAAPTWPLRPVSLAWRDWMKGRGVKCHLTSPSAGRRSGDRSRPAVLGWLTGTPDRWVTGAQDRLDSIGLQRNAVNCIFIVFVFASYLEVLGNVIHKFVCERIWGDIQHGAGKGIGIIRAARWAVINHMSLTLLHSSRLQGCQFHKTLFYHYKHFHVPIVHVSSSIMAFSQSWNLYIHLQEPGSWSMVRIDWLRGV